jgi:alpha-1,2-mannosyltransferase
VSRKAYLTICCLFVAAATGLIWLSDVHNPQHRMDLEIYRKASRAFLGNGDPYDVESFGWPFQYPPFSLLLFTPLSHMNATLAALLWTSFNAALVVFLAWVTLAHVWPTGSVAGRRLGTLGLAFAMGWFAPFDEDFFWGQINILLMALVVADVMLLKDTRWQGVLIGIAAAVKLYPIAFVVYLLVTRRTRAALVSAASFCLAGLVMFAADFKLARTFWVDVLPHIDDAQGHPEGIGSNSLYSSIVRMVHDSDTAVVPWLVTAAVVFIAGAWVAAYAHRQKQELLGLATFALTSLVCLPIAWSHYWVWEGISITCLAFYAYRLRSLPLALFVVLEIALFHARLYRAPNMLKLSYDQELNSLTALQQIQVSLYQILTVLGIAVAFLVCRAVSAGRDRDALRSLPPLGHDAADHGRA